MVIYVPSYAWWFVVAAGVVYGVAFWLLLTSQELPGVSRQKFLFPLLTLGVGLGLYFMEHFYRLSLENTLSGGGTHPLSFEHLLSELLPLALVLGLAATKISSWLGWAIGLALVATGDSFILLFSPGPLVNHLFQLLAVVAFIWGIWGLWISMKLGKASIAGPLALAAAGGVGTYCEIGMMFL